MLFISVCIDAAQAEAAVAPFSAMIQGNKQPQQQSVSVNTRCVCLSYDEMDVIISDYEK